MAEEPDDSHQLDMVNVFASSNHDAEMEALAIQGVMDANGIPAMIVGPGTLPVLEFEVQVPKERLAEARQALAEAKAAGPSAAAEAEAASEQV